MRPSLWGGADGPGLLNPLITIHSDVLEQAAAEIRDNPRIEVGGKFVGYVHGDFSARSDDWRESFSRLRITVLGNLDAGPGRNRSAVHHYSDTDYQLHLYRRLAEEFPALCFLGIWHSHHPNGLRELSGGDMETGLRTVNSDGHDLDLLLSSLAFDQSGLRGGRHFVFFRGHRMYYEIESSCIEVTDDPNPVTAAVTRNARWLRGQRSPLHSQPPAAGSQRPVPGSQHSVSGTQGRRRRDGHVQPVAHYEDPAHTVARQPVPWLQSPEGREALAFDNAWLRQYPSLHPALRDGGVIWQGPVEAGTALVACAYQLPGRPGDSPVAEFSAAEEGISMRLLLPDRGIRPTRFAALLEAFSALVSRTATPPPVASGPEAAAPGAEAAAAGAEAAASGTEAAAPADSGNAAIAEAGPAEPTQHAPE